MSGCRFVASDRPRMVCTQDHARGEWCEDCAVCREAHCRVCRHAHHEQTCPECLADARETLHAIAEMCGSLPTEAVHRGVEGEAANLSGPVADPEARGHLEASVAVGRVPADYLDDAGGRGGCSPDHRHAMDTHPLWVSSSWAMVYRAEFEHDEPINAVTLADELGYLERNLTYASTWPHVPFEDMARDLRRCRTHLEAVLHDAERGVRANVPCFECHADLERKLGRAGFDDEYTCRGCKRRYTIAEYNFALRAELEASA